MVVDSADQVTSEAKAEVVAGSSPKSRRSLLAAGASGIVGLLAGSLVRPGPAEAVTGTPLYVGQSNPGGSSTTGLVVNSAATALAVTQTGTSLNGSNGIMSNASYGTGGVFTSSYNTALLAIASDPDQNALWAQNTAESMGIGAAIHAEGGQNDAILGRTDAGDGAGVIGVAASMTGSNIGVYGYTESTVDGWGVVSDGDLGTTGDLYVTGTIAKGGGSFKIDHPLEPANKYLYHSFVESPDMKNIYDGIVTLDGDGEATVELPAWFGALNRDIRYQLTAVGRTDRPLYIKSEVKDNQFSIAGGTSGQTVSWQLTGIRQDAWANAHRIPVEEAKAKADRGLYLHPSENGEPAAKGIDRVRTKALRERVGKTK